MIGRVSWKKARRKTALVRADAGRIRVAQGLMGSFAGYDRLFSHGANNALLASITSYSEFVPAFRALLAQKHDDLPSSTPPCASWAGWTSRNAMLGSLP